MCSGLDFLRASRDSREGRYIKPHHTSRDWVLTFPLRRINSPRSKMQKPSSSMKGFYARDWIFFHSLRVFIRSKEKWSYPRPLSASAVWLFIYCFCEQVHNAPNKKASLSSKGLVPGTGFLPSWDSISCKFCVSNMCREIKHAFKLLRLIFTSSRLFSFSNQRYIFLLSQI